MSRWPAILLLLAVSLPAAEFRNGQAARAVIGQSSFSSHDSGVSAVALAIANGRLYAAEAGRQLLTFDLTKLPALTGDPGERSASSCAVCGFAPVASTNQSVMLGIATVAVFGKTAIMADPGRHRVLIWRDVTRSSARPDVILGRLGESLPSPSALVDPVSVAFDGQRVFVGDGVLHRVLVWNGLPGQDDQPADAVLGQPNFTSAAVADSPGADTIRFPAALASDGVNLFVADPPDQRILVFTPGDFPLSPLAIVNSASLLPGPLAPGTLVDINVNGSIALPSGQQVEAGSPLKKRPHAVEVLLNGVALPLLSVKSNTIEAQLPYDIPASAATSLYLLVKQDGDLALSTAVSVQIAAATPGLYAFGGTEPRTGLLLHANSQKSDLGGSPVTGDSPARPGEELTLWATGLGLVNDGVALSPLAAGVPFSGPAARVLLPVSATIDGEPVEVRSAILTPGAVGVYEIHVLLPEDLRSEPDAELIVSQNGYTSNTIQFPISSQSEK